MKNVLTLLAKRVAITLGLTTAVSAADTAIQNKIHRSGISTLKFWKKQMKDVMEIAKYFKGSGLLDKGVNRTIKNEVKEQNRGFPGVLAATLGDNLLVNIIADNGKTPGQAVIIAGKGTTRVGQDL